MCKYSGAAPVSPVLYGDDTLEMVRRRLVPKDRPSQSLLTYVPELWGSVTPSQRATSNVII